jgi:hypothetical protein
MNRQLPPELLERLKARSLDSLPQGEGRFDPEAVKDAARLLGIKGRNNDYWNAVIDFLDEHYPLWRGYEVSYGNIRGVRNA